MRQVVIVEVVAATVPGTYARSTTPRFLVRNQGEPAVSGPMWTGHEGPRHVSLITPKTVKAATSVGETVDLGRLGGISRFVDGRVRIEC
jgi:hypothetical protein